MIVDLLRKRVDCVAIRIYIAFFLELAERGSLRDYIRSHRGKPNMELSLRWATDIAEGACL